MFLGTIGTIGRTAAAVVSLLRWSATDKNANVSVSGDQLTASWSGSTGGVRGTISRSAGPAAYSQRVTGDTTTASARIGIATGGSSLNLATATGITSIRTSNGDIAVGSTTAVAATGNIPSGSDVEIRLNDDASQVSFYVNGTLRGTVTTSGTKPYFPWAFNSTAVTSNVINGASSPDAPW